MASKVRNNKSSLSAPSSTRSITHKHGRQMTLQTGSVSTRSGHVRGKKSASRRTSTSSAPTKTKPDKKRAVDEQHERESFPKASDRALLRMKRSELVVADRLANPSLSFTAATRKRKVDPRWVLKHRGSKFRKDSSGRIRAKVRKARHKTLYKPTSTPGVSVPVVTKNRGERLLLGQWMAALNDAGRNDWSKMMRFPKEQMVGGILLETDPNEVQAILRALAEEESPFEGLYRTTVRPHEQHKRVSQVRNLQQR